MCVCVCVCVCVSVCVCVCACMCQKNSIYDSLYSITCVCFNMTMIALYC